MIRKYTYFLLLTVLIACNNETPDMQSNTAVIHEMPKELEGYSKILVPLVNGEAEIQVPGKKLTSSSPEIFNNNSGLINIKIGENFHLEISEQNTDFDRLISDLNQDIFYTSNIISQKDDEIIYEQGLPDGSKKFVHFCKLIKTSDQNMTIRSSKNGQFRQSHIDRMMKSANTFNPEPTTELLGSTSK